MWSSVFVLMQDPFDLFPGRFRIKFIRILNQKPIKSLGPGHVKAGVTHRFFRAAIAADDFDLVAGRCCSDIRDLRWICSCLSLLRIITKGPFGMGYVNFVDVRFKIFQNGFQKAINIISKDVRGYFHGLRSIVKPISIFSV